MGSSNRLDVSEEGNLSLTEIDEIRYSRPVSGPHVEI